MEWGWAKGAQLGRAQGQAGGVCGPSRRGTARLPACHEPVSDALGFS